MSTTAWSAPGTVTPDPTPPNGRRSDQRSDGPVAEQTDWIDLDTDIDETLGSLTDLVRQGKIRYIGTSTFDPARL
ncbi:aldo/keto reductase [Arthrobacter sp. D1-29]